MLRAILLGAGLWGGLALVVDTRHGPSEDWGFLRAGALASAWVYGISSAFALGLMFSAGVWGIALVVDTKHGPSEN